MANFFSYVVPMVVLLGLLIFVHELGHFLVAKYFKVRVEVFSLGFGKKLLSFKRGDTEYCLSAFPLGGYVKMFGDDPAAEIPESEKQASFLHKPVAQRIAVVLAGPLMNLFFAILLYASISMIGEKELFPSVGDLDPASAAATLGFRSGDTILDIDGRSVAHWREVEKIIHANAGKSLRFGVQHADGQTSAIMATPQLVANPNVLSWDKQIGDIAGLNPSSRAALIAIHNPESLAAKAGLKTGDSIIKINDTQIHKQREVLTAMAGFMKQPEIKFTVQRGLIDTIKTGDVPAEMQTIEATIKIPQDAHGLAAEAALMALGIESPDLYLASIEPKSPAETAGLMIGDKLVSISGNQLHKFEQVVEFVRSFNGKDPLDFVILRDGKEIPVKIAPNVKKRMNLVGQEESRYEVGVRPLIIDDLPQTVSVRTANIVEAAQIGITKSFERSGLIVLGLLRLFQGEVSAKNVGGFLSIGQMAKRSWSMGAVEFLMAMAFISLNLFILNLLPVPVLDGGHLVFYSIEAISGAPLSLQKMELAQKVGAALLFGLMAFALFNDVSRIFFK